MRMPCASIHILAFYAEPKRNQGSLLIDILEKFRPHFADRIVFSLFGKGVIPL
ncbi:MAG TPA: hypothetical protein DIT32_00425 [Peptococcaceae bacterium]|nr:hypothetical protein [Peptococcaceae bacterium]